MRDIIANGEKKITFTLKFKNNEGSFSAKPMLKSDNPRSYKRALGVLMIQEFITITY